MMVITSTQLYEIKRSGQVALLKSDPQFVKPSHNIAALFEVHFNIESYAVEYYFIYVDNKFFTAVKSDSLDIYSIYPANLCEEYQECLLKEITKLT